MKSSRLLFITIVLVLFVSSCSFKGTNLKPEDLEYVNSFLNNADNGSINTLKGLGSAKIVSRNSRNAVRIAFALEKPCKLRIVAMAGGQPIETMATNCYNIYILSHSNSHSFYKKKLTDYTLESIINVPVTTDDIILFLTGGIPVKDHDYIELSRNLNGYDVISLKKRWSGIREKIFIKKSIVEKVSIYDDGKLMYSVSIKYKKTDKYKLPESFRFEKDLRNYFSLHIQRTWPNQPVKSSTFVLTPKD